MEKSQNGFALLFAAFLTLLLVTAIGLSITKIVINRYNTSSSEVKSLKVYFAAESGIEDALLRLRKNMNWTSSYNMNIASTTISVNISEELGGSRTITAESNLGGIKRKVSAVYEISQDTVSFYYGAQVGEGGILMRQLSRINGNVFSNGPVIGEFYPEITGTVKVASSTNKISNITIGEDAYAQTCEQSSISGILFTNSNQNCTASDYQPLSEPIQPLPLPISQEQIDRWKSEAEKGGTISGFTLDGFTSFHVGPKKINGDVVVKNLSELIVEGTLWITGNLTVKNISQVRLSKEVYGPLSGVIIVDGITNLKNFALALGSGEPGSYLIILSTNPSHPSITIEDGFLADILYAQNGWILVKNLAEVREISGYGIELSNLAEITYEIGLQDVSFSSGPSAGWKVTDWKETY